jgi:galactokinase
MKQVPTADHKLRADTSAFLALLDRLPAGLEDFFLPAPEIIVTRAPGRLDLMGGIADYSGSLVLQLPIAAATHAALQLRADDTLHLISLSHEAATAHRSFSMSLAEFGTAATPLTYQSARAKFASDPPDHWAAYVAGAFLVLLRERGVAVPRGANILIRSDVPEGKGVSSSAALEVSVMQAINAAYDLALTPRELAFLCQRVENLVAGAPCGVMDQMTAACGEADQLLALLCQPGELLEPVKLPDELAVWGIDSGIRHAVTGADYGRVRTAAFMGYRMIAEIAGLPCRVTSPGHVQIEDTRWRGYLANVTPQELAADFAAQVPREISGAEFLARYQGITDAVTTVQPEQRYPVWQATQHPVREHARVRQCASVLQHWQGDGEAETLGELTYQSHASYSACGLGSEGTDELVRLVREAGPESGLYGAKITGGGSGGTVAVLGRRDAGAVVQRIAARYAEQTGRAPLIMTGSSPGAGAFGHLKLNREPRVS